MGSICAGKGEHKSECVSSINNSLTAVAISAAMAIFNQIFCFNISKTVTSTNLIIVFLKTLFSYHGLSIITEMKVCSRNPFAKFYSNYKVPSTRIRFHIVFISLSCRRIVFTENDINVFSNLSTLETVFKLSFSMKTIIVFDPVFV